MVCNIATCSDADPYELLYGSGNSPYGSGSKETNFNINFFTKIKFLLKYIYAYTYTYAYTYSYTYTYTYSKKRNYKY